jgi:plastocyanin domain-containing protein
MKTSFAQNRAEVFEHPYREFSVILTEGGYFPRKIVAFEGDKVKLFVTSTIDKPECLVVEDHKIFLEATKGKITHGESVFKKAGEYKFYCPSSQYKGMITVLKKPKVENISKSVLPTREVASEKPSHWTPRDYD